VGLTTDRTWSAPRVGPLPRGGCSPRVVH